MSRLLMHELYNEYFRRGALHTLPDENGIN